MKMKLIIATVLLVACDETQQPFFSPEDEVRKPIDTVVDKPIDTVDTE